MADADPDPAIIIAANAADGPQSVVAGIPAPCFDTHDTGFKIQLVMKNHNIIQTDLEKPDRLIDRLARQIHEGFGLEQNSAVGAEGHFGCQAGKLLFPR